MISDGERFVVANGIRHWCRIAGAARSTIPVIAIHGGPGGNHYVFERTILAPLGSAVTTICYEQRGCGRSDPPPSADQYSIPLLVSDLDELRAALGLPSVILLGYSFGSELAMEYALAHPNRVARMVLQAPGAPATPRQAADVQVRGFAAVASANVRDAVRSIVESDDSPEVKQRQLWAVVDTETVDAFLFENAAAALQNRTLWRESGLANTGAMERAFSLREASSVSLHDRLGRVDVPCLILVGRHDRNVGVQQATEVAHRMPRARLHVFERSAHFPDLEETDEFLRLVVPFLTSALT